MADVAKFVYNILNKFIFDSKFLDWKMQKNLVENAKISVGRTKIYGLKKTRLKSNIFGMDVNLKRNDDFLKISLSERKIWAKLVLFASIA